MCFFLFLCIPGLPQGSIVYEGEQHRFFGDHTLVFSTSADLSVEEVTDRLDSFSPSPGAVPNFGVSTKHHWVYFEIHNASSSDKILLSLAYPNIDCVEYFFLAGDSDEVLVHQVTGESRVFDSREYSFKDFAFTINLSPGQAGRVLLHLRSSDQLMVPLKLQNYEETVQENLVQDTLFGVYAGIIMVMFLYNLFIFFSTRDRTYLLYVIYIISMGLTQAVLQGYAFKFLWPGNTYMAQLAIYIVGALSGVTVLFFTRDFLKIRETSKWIDNYLLTLGGLDIVGLLLAVLGFRTLGFNIINTIAALGSFSLMAVAVYYAIRGVRAARFFLVAWSVFLGSVVLFVLKDFGLIVYNEVTARVIMAGSAIEVVMLSLALADRINVLKMEREDAQRRELDAVKEKEKLVSEQNIVLEQKVNERTEALRAANQQLNKALNELKHAQAQLVNAEKMASLGQLTAGIAHEINNPINFVAASVTPLKRDLHELMGLVERYDGILKAAALDDGVEEIRKYKDEIDYEFTIEEIGELLRGVDEGARRTAEIVQGLKNFSRLDEADSKFADIHDCIESTLVVLRNMMPSDMLIERDYDRSIGEIECYPGKLNQVFSNIFVNAIQAMKDLPSPKIVVTTKNLGDTITVSVRDYGKGIPENIRSKVFEPFFTTKDVGEGTGLGLSIVHSIIEQHKGKVELETEVGRGTVFIFTLPKSIF